MIDIPAPMIFKSFIVQLCNNNNKNMYIRIFTVEKYNLDSVIWGTKENDL